MQFFSSPQCPQCQRVRVVLAEKEAQARCIFVDDPQSCADLSVFNPDNTLPTFTDRGMTLLEPRIIMEYLDDRYPHPPLMPVDPVGKARARVWMQEVERKLYDQLEHLRSSGTKRASRARETMKDFLHQICAELKQRGDKKFFLGDNFTLLDASLTPILWRLHLYKIDVRQRVLWEYARKVYARQSFQRSLTDAERELHLPK